MKGRFPIWLTVLGGAAVLIQILVLQQAWTVNPISRATIGDGQVYWNWAGRIAAGEFVGDTPFLSAPLYAYFLALLRVFGLGLLGVYVVQAALHVATAVLIADAARCRFGSATGGIAGALFLLLNEPAYYAGRILHVNLQLFTLAWLMWQAALLGERPSRIRLAGLGLALGCAVLANPSMLAVVPFLAAWVAWCGPGRELRGACGVLLLVMLVMTPAAVHNYLVCGEVILVSAQTGVTFFHGNAPGAQGTYQPIPGVSANRLQQNLDAYRLAAEATGREGWSATSRYFLGQGLSYLAAHPAEAVKLKLRKLWWLLSGRNYGDLYVPRLEAREEFGSRLRLAPLTLAGLMPLASLGFVLVARWGWRQGLPELLFFLTPALVVLVFWYSPRYRLPMAPAAVVLAAYALKQVARSLRARPRRLVLPISAALMIVAGAGTGWINRAIGFDDPHTHRPGFLHLVGDALRMQGRAADAQRYLEQAVEQGFDTAASRYGLAQVRAMQGEALLATGDPRRRAEAVEFFSAAARDMRASLRHDSRQLDVHENLAELEFWFWQLGRQSAAAARREFEAALALADRIGDVEAAARLREGLRRLHTARDRSDPMRAPAEP